MNDAERLVALLREIGFTDAELLEGDSVANCRKSGPVEPRDVPYRYRVNIGVHLMFNAEGKLVAMESEYDGVEYEITRAETR